MGAVSRRRGNRHEVAMAAALSAIVPEGEVITTRNARGGAQGGADLCWLLADGTARLDVMGWTVECKQRTDDPTPHVWTSWLHQAAAAGSGRPVVLYRRVGARHGWACEPHRDGIRLVPLAQWLQRLADRGERCP